MITILRGEDEHIVRANCISRFAESDRPIWIESPPGVHRYWNCFRRMLPQVREHIGQDPVDRVLDRHRVVASLVLGRLRAELSSTEKKQLDDLAARMSSHLSHNWFLDKPVLHGLAEVVSDLSASNGLTLFIPDLATVERAALAMLVATHRRFSENAPDIVIGFVPGPGNREIDDYGLAWGQSEEDIGEVVRALLSIPGAGIEDVSALTAPSNALNGSQELDRWDDDPDGNAHEILKSANGRLGRGEIDAVMHGALRAFEAFSRDVSIRLALRLLEKQPEMERGRLAFLHELIGLSAHNWQFDSEHENKRLSDFLGHHFDTALKLEDDPVMQIALRYRLAVTLGRRKRDFQKALDVANRAVDQAATADIPRGDSLYQGIWARNIRAYVHMRRGEFEKAFEDSTACVDMVENLINSVEEPSRDVKFTRTTVFDNNLALCRIAGREDLLYRRAKANMRLLEEDPEAFGGRFSAGGWIYLYREKHRLDLAIKAAEHGLRDAEPDYIHFMWFYLSQLGDLYYRKGDASQAFRYFGDTTALRKYLRSVQDLVFLSQTIAAIRAGKLAWAEDELRRARTHPEAETPATKMEIEAAQALVFAHLHSTEEAEKCINRAIDLATESGVRDHMLTVARAAGRAALLLGHRSEALEAFRQGLELARIKGDCEPPPGSLVSIILGLAECGEEDPERLYEAFQLMPEALLEDEESWWELPKLLPRFGGLVGSVIDADSRRNQKTFGQLLTAARQRDDCAAAAGELRKVLPPSIDQESIVL